jgi:hypothetical protein
LELSEPEPHRVTVLALSKWCYSGSATLFLNDNYLLLNVYLEGKINVSELADLKFTIFSVSLLIANPLMACEWISPLIR